MRRIRTALCWRVCSRCLLAHALFFCTFCRCPVPTQPTACAAHSLESNSQRLHQRHICRFRTPHAPCGSERACGHHGCYPHCCLSCLLDLEPAWTTHRRNVLVLRKCKGALPWSPFQQLLLLWLQTIPRVRRHPSKLGRRKSANV